ncbi:ATP-binding protein [Hippea sp. KM1]|uniref:ATP-binding protein n=1 Tax=Hippea sp. KM1 TaxID=944481 RepID=UPI00046CBD7F|nr:ATP-binding protein [Hippea sp. KM1]
MKCRRCKKEAEVELRSHNAAFCRDCFLLFFYNQLNKAIKQFRMFTKKQRILLAVSGGKDSMSLWLALVELGYDVTALFVDLGISGFSELARKKVVAFSERFNAPLRVVDLKEEGIPIPEVVKKLKRPACAVCGRIKRYYFNMEGLRGGFDVLATGHNLDDETSRLFSNVLHWKMEYLEDQAPVLPDEDGLLRKVKPFFRLTEFEIAAYAFFKGIDYLTSGCPFSKGATFSSYKRHLNRIEYESPATKIDFYQGFLKNLRPLLKKKAKEELHHCRVCGYPTFGDVCFVCRLKGFE